MRRVSTYRTVQFCGATSIDASPEAAAFLAPYKAAITKLLAAENASTGALMDVPQGQQPDPATPPDTSPDMPATTPATA
jgi:hypothetical protein